jgi:choline-sulfatase
MFDIDCLRPDHLGCYGYGRPTSPNIDKIAGNGVRFTNYSCATSPCLPSRTEWQSGRFGIRNGVVSNIGAGANFNIRKTSYSGPIADNDTLMRTLRRAGLDTISFSNFADRHSAWYWMCGWTEFHTPNLKCGGESAPEVNAPVLDWIKKNKGRDNYLLHINYWDTHRVYKMDGSWADRFAGTPCPAWPDEEAVAKHQSITGKFTAHAQFRDGVSPWPLMPGGVGNRAEFEHIVTGYDASIAYVDHHLGIILDALAADGGLDDTAIIVTSDHGDSFGEHGVYADHTNASSSIHNIPLIVKWPGKTTGGRAADSMLCNVDLPATLCELMGHPIPEDWDGVSFLPQLEGKPGVERDFLVWQHALYTVQRGVRTRDHLMVRTYDNHNYKCADRDLYDDVELYNLTTDPYETTNLHDQEPNRVAEMDGLMSQWVDEQLSKPNSIPDPLMGVLDERGIR